MLYLIGLELYRKLLMRDTVSPWVFLSYSPKLVIMLPWAFMVFFFFSFFLFFIIFVPDFPAVQHLGLNVFLTASKA